MVGDTHRRSPSSRDHPIHGLESIRLVKHGTSVANCEDDCFSYAPGLCATATRSVKLTLDGERDDFGDRG